MKIVQLNTYCGSGSTGRIAVDIARYASRQGAETVIGFGAGTVPEDAQVYALRIGGKLDRKWHGAIRKLLDMEGYGSILTTRRLIGFLKEYQPDVIHLHNLHGCYLNHRLLFRHLRAAGIPVVWTLHDCWPFTGHCAYFDYVGCERWKTECHHCPQRNTYPVCIGPDGSRRNQRRRRRLFAAVPAMALVAPCGWLRELAAQSFLRETPCRVIYNGVNRTLFQPTENKLREAHGITQPHLVLAVASEWEERKGLRYLPELAERLGPDYRLALIGLTQEQIASLPAGILGFTKTSSPTELAAWYTAADCLANPTMEDNMPLVNLEAMACGTPVVVFRTGGCPECVTDACGAVVPKGDVAAMAQAVRRVCERRGAYREACLAQAERFDGGNSAQAYWELYQEVTR